jgi:hypothetical protein
LTAVLVGAVAPLVLYGGIAEAATPHALWHMDTLPQMTDSSGYGNNGTTTAITLVAGSSGKGYHFNGKTSVATVKDSNSLDPGTATIKITAHVHFSVVPSKTVVDYDLVRKGLSGTKGGDWKMEIFPSTPGGSVAPAYCFFQDAKGAKASVRGTTNLAGSAWHTISCTKTSSGVTLTVDGSSRTVSASLGSISNAAPLALGAKPGGGDQYNGDMDEVSVQIG